jgi:uncharacterized protein YbjT (DUF2867 family)
MAGKIVVLGATGKQGGSVVRALLADGSFKVAAVTRNTTSEQAQKLKGQGVETLQADGARCLRLHCR